MADTQNTDPKPESGKTEQQKALLGNDERLLQLFPWYENLLEQGLRAVHDQEPSQQKQIYSVLKEMEDSSTFWKLAAAFDRAREPVHDEYVEEWDIIRVLCARFYIAGSLRKRPLMESDCRW